MMLFNRIILMHLVLASMTAVVYRDVITFQFIDYDDNIYITKNPHVCEGDLLSNVGWAFTSLETGNWHPITWVSHILDCRAFGFDPMGHHLTSVLIHLVTGLLIFQVFRRMSNQDWPSFFTAAIFLVHPMHVESVAWVAERKDVLCVFFWIVTIWLYLCYLNRQSILRYFFVFFGFALAIMSKPMAVTLPFVLVLLDYWPLNRTASYCWGEKQKYRIVGLVIEKIPLFLLSGIASLIAFWGQRNAGALNDQTLFEKLTVSAASYWTYIVKFFWPEKLTFLYPYSQMDWTITQLIGAVVALFLITALFIYRLKSQPYLLVAWFLFLGTLVPVIGLVKIGGHFVADRYSYFPYLGLSIICCWGINAYRKVRLPLGILGGITLAVFMILAHNQSLYWKNSEVLFRRAIEVTSGNYLAHNYLGGEYFKKGRLEKARQQFVESIRINQGFADGHYNLGGVYYSQNLLEDARNEFQAAVILNPDYFMAKRYLEKIREGKLMGH